MAFIKVCGMTDARAVDAALAAGVDAIGFVFAASVRNVTPQQAAQLAQPARGRALCVAVTLHPDAAQLQDIFGIFRPDVLQTDAQDLASLALPANGSMAGVARPPPQPAGLNRASLCCSKVRAAARQGSRLVCSTPDGAGHA